MATAAAATRAAWGKRTHDLLSFSDDHLLPHSPDPSYKRARFRDGELDLSVVEKLNDLGIDRRCPQSAQASPLEVSKGAVGLAADLLLETQQATDAADAKGRIAGMLSSLEVRVREEFESVMRRELVALQERIAELSRENAMLKRAAEVQGDLSRRSEEEMQRVVRGLTEVAWRRMEQIRELECSNRALGEQLQRIQQNLLFNGVDVVSLRLHPARDC